MAMLSKKEVVERTGLSAVTIWRRVNVGDLAMAARMPMIAITISSSMSVKPDAVLWVECMTIH